MTSSAIATVVKMMESVPEYVQEQCVEHLRLYLEEMRDELVWDAAYRQTQVNLAAAAQKTRQQIAAGIVEPMDFDKL
jgi:hypothetical protein